MKIAICLPIHNSGAKPAFVRCLGRLIVRTCAENIGAEIEIFDCSTVTSDGRTILVREALRWGADYLLWLDSDQTFAPETLLRLLSLNRDVVGANIPTRGTPTLPTAVDDKGEFVQTTPELADEGLVQEVESLGMGILLVSAQAFVALERHAKQQGRKTFWPLFAMEWGADGRIKLGEDRYFVRKLREAGVSVFIDHAVSGAAGHIADRVLTHSDVLQVKSTVLNIPPEVKGGAT